MGNGLAWRGVLRSKAFCYVAADHHSAYEWAQAGGVSHVGPKGLWSAAVPRERWSMPDDERPDRQPDWHPRYGDRVQKLIVIGQHMDEADLRQRLAARHLPSAVANADSAAWAELPSPFPGVPSAVEEPAAT